MRVYIDGPEDMCPIYFDTITEAREWLNQSSSVKEWLRDYDFDDDVNFHITQMSEYDHGDGWPYESHTFGKLRRKHRIPSHAQWLRAENERIRMERERISKMLAKQIRTIGIVNEVLEYCFWPDQISILFRHRLNPAEFRAMSDFVKMEFGSDHVDQWDVEDDKHGKYVVFNFSRLA